MLLDKAMKDRKIILNNEWDFYLQEDVMDYEVGEAIIAGSYKGNKWRRLDLPHDWSIELDFNIEHSCVGSEAGYLDGGIGWYRKQFVLPVNLQGKCISIHFGGVYMDSTVYVNGRQVGNYPNGYMPFSYDLTNDLVVDGSTLNTVLVKVVNQQPSSRWYSGSGIYRDVELVITDAVHVVEYGAFVTTPNLETHYAKGKGLMNIATEVKNASAHAQKVKLRATLYDDAGKVYVGECIETDELMIEAHEVCLFEQQLMVQNPKLWCVEYPNLYKLYIEVIVAGEVVDTYVTRCGFRWIKFDPSCGFFLNGVWMKLKGVCMHHDQGALGAVANKRAITRQMEIMKEMGANAIRVTHNPAADELLEICDEMGLMVIDEAFDTWYGSKKQYDLGRFFASPSMSHPDGSPIVSWAEFDVKQMVKRGRNFPCIIKWSVGNEVWEATGDGRSIKTIGNLKKWVAEVDPTRGITQGVDKFRFGTGEGGHEVIAKYQQTVGFNYAESNYDRMHKKHPTWALYGSETSSATKSRGVYSHPDTIGSHDAGEHLDYQQSSYDNDHVAWGATASQAWIADRDRGYIAGQFVWTGFDYIGEPTPWHNTGGPGHHQSPKSAYFGIVDTAGFPKDDYYLYQSVWKSVDTAPMVHILPHWNWEDEGLRKQVTGVDGKIPIRVYSNAPHVELFVDGQSQGSQSFEAMTTDYGLEYQQQSKESTCLYQEWRLNYTHKVGTKIEAVAKDKEGKMVAIDAVTTAGKATQLGIYADRECVYADGRDLCYITVDLQDAAGNFVPTANEQLYFELEGAGEIVGVDNGNPISHERYKSQHDGTWQRKAFNGKVLVIVQATHQKGTFTLKAWADTIEAKNMTLQVCEPKGQQLQQLESLSQGNLEISQSHASIPFKTPLSVYEAIATESITLPFVEGMGVTMPQKVVVYYTQGLVKEVPVKWEDKYEVILENDKEQINCVYGTVEGVATKARATLRKVKDHKQLQLTDNYAKQWTGSQFPAALASYTNKEEGCCERVSYLNDTMIDMERTSQNKWSNYHPQGRASDWIGVLFAEGGKLTTRYIDQLKLAFVENESLGGIEKLRVEYYVPSIEPEVPRDFGNITEGDLANEANWRNVDDLQQMVDDTHETMQTLSFQSVCTYAIRIHLTTAEGKKGVGVTELEAYGKKPIPYDACQVLKITLGGVDLLGKFDQNNTYECSHEKELEQSIEVSATNHAKVTIVPATKECRVVKIYIIPENGDIGETQIYQLQLKRHSIGRGRQRHSPNR